MAPDGWRESKLEDIAEKVMVGIASAATHAYAEHGIRMLRNLNIKDGWIDDSDILYVHEEYEKSFRNKRLKSGDILTVRTGYPGISAVVPSSYEGAQCFTALITRLNKEKALPEYVCRYINSEYGRRFVTRGEAGGAQKNVNAGMLKKLLIPLPPIREQQKIADILSAWDEAITITELLLANSEQQKKALMQQLLTGKKRLTGFKGGWSTARMGNIFRRVTTKNEGQSSNVVTISAQKGLVRQQEFFKKSVASETLEGYFLLKKGQFAYNKSYSNGYPMGAIKKLNRYSDAVVTTLYICFDVADPEVTDSEYFEHFFEAGLLNHGLSKVANEGGRAHGLLNVKPSDFFSLRLPLPDIEEQKAIAKVITAADEEIERFKQDLMLLKDEKRALMQRLLTGKRRVKIDEAERVSA